MDRARAPVASHAVGAERRRAVTSQYGQLFQTLLPELALVLGALIVLGADLLRKNARPNSERLSFSVTIALLAIAGAVYGSLRAGVAGDVLGGVLVTDSLALATRLGVLLLGALTLAFLPGVLRL